MNGIGCIVFVVLTFLLSLARGDVEVSCVFMQSCFLPCSFQPGRDVVIHWIQETTGNTRVHSYYHNQDQLAHQDQRFRYRTSLFKDQISRGNASLQLTEMQVQDQGRYKCYTSIVTGNKESFINVKVAEETQGKKEPSKEKTNLTDTAPVNPTSNLTSPTKEETDPSKMQDNILLGEFAVIMVLAVVGWLAALCIYKKPNVCKTKCRETTDQTGTSDQAESSELKSLKARRIEKISAEDK